VWLVELKEKYRKKLKELYRKKTNKDIDDAVALEYLEGLIELVRNVYRPIPIAKKSELACLLKK